MGQGGGPLDRVVAVVGLVLEGVPLALGGVAAAHVLHDDHVAARDGLAANRRRCPCRRACAGAGREFAVAGGTVDVGVEGDAVAGLHGDVALDDDFRSGLAQGGDQGGEYGDGQRPFEHSFLRKELPELILEHEVHPRILRATYRLLLQMQIGGLGLRFPTHAR